ncbi:MAG: hypothetical protein NUK65_03500 [Firmicutes bacterium]|nr:hypothetical protein [Bacillota bacterium]
MLAYLTEQEKEISILRFGLELTFKEISAVTQIPESTVKYQLTRAIEKLQSVYGHSEGSELL